MHVWVCIYNVYACVYSYICMYVGVLVWWGVCVCMHVWHTCVGTCVSILCVCVNSSPSLCIIACYSDCNSFVRSKLGNMIFGLVFIVDSIDW